MPRLIFKCPYIKGGAQNASHLDNYVRYISTRKGVEKIMRDDNSLPATEGQREMVRKITKDFPLSRGMFEYKDYLDAPTRGNASEFISRALEDNYDSIGKRENYVQYIAQRPHVQITETHGLFNETNDRITLTQTAKEVAEHSGNVWLPIFSLRREDATRLGYDNVEAWQTLLTAHIPQLAEAMKIPLEDFRWYAAFHDEGHHPHVHMVCYSEDPTKGYLTREGIKQIRSDFAREIFRSELTQIYQQQTEARDDLRDTTKEMLAEIIDQIQTGSVTDPRVGELLEQLSEKLSHCSGQMKYGYLKKPVKELVDEIIDRLAEDPRISKAYSLWYDLRDEVLRTYKDDMPKRIPLSQQSEFKPIKNIIIAEAVRLGELSSAFASDEIEPEDADEPSFDPTEEMKTVWQQAAEYQRHKELLYDSDASYEEKRAALTSLEQLYDSGFVVAAHLLGKVYRDGVVDTPDPSAAEWWFYRSASVGNDYSQYALGKLLETQKRYEEATDWLSQAAEQNNRYAQYRLAKLLLTGDDIPKDVDRAISLLTSSAERGYQYAQYTLGKLYLLGKEIPKDMESAVYWLSLASAQGNEQAQYFLDHRYDWHNTSISLLTGRLLHHLGNLFRDRTRNDANGRNHVVERKLMRKIREKQAALGIKSEGMQQRF